MKIEEFKVGKWYKNLGSQEDWVGKYIKHDLDQIHKFQASEWIHPNKEYEANGFGIMSYFKNAELCTPEEIYEFLPENHPDKIKPLKVIDDLGPLIKLLNDLK